MTRTIPELETPFGTYAPYQWEDVQRTMYDLTETGALARKDLFWNQVLNLEPSGQQPDSQLELLFWLKCEYSTSFVIKINFKERKVILSR
ncbi:hypothetical protein AVEN_235630-1 [Araneus ventricosus]|uniref:Uncharacterized protein n=1 Tax=Araneus ventricosus TaxID=182803 RepID=A0A4Y2BTV4_ARAVE|nr:hypothetical protein AVEN_235630-1 [Araneus ventricosus]